MTTANGVRAVVAGHGAFAEGLVSAVEQISGRGALFAPLSNAGLGAPELEQALTTLLSGTGAQVVFTDLPAGSCTMAARRAQRVHPTLVLVTGVNLGTVLEFAFRSDVAAPADAAREAADKGRATLVVTGG